MEAQIEAQEEAWIAGYESFIVEFVRSSSKNTFCVVTAGNSSVVLGPHQLHPQAWRILWLARVCISLLLAPHLMMVEWSGAN